MKAALKTELTLDNQNLIKAELREYKKKDKKKEKDER
jgi:hypothetical protein